MTFGVPQLTQPPQARLGESIGTLIPHRVRTAADAPKTHPAEMIEASRQAADSFSPNKRSQPLHVTTDCPETSTRTANLQAFIADIKDSQ